MLHHDALAEWEASTYRSTFIVEAIYDGPIDGWFYVTWGAVDDRHLGSRPKFVCCQCRPCVPPCPEDRVPESVLLEGSPELLAAYKTTGVYAGRVAEMQADARRRVVQRTGS